MRWNHAEVKSEQKRMNKLHKKIRKEIVKELDVTDKTEMTAFAYLESVNDQFNAIVRWIDEQEKAQKYSN